MLTLTRKVGERIKIGDDITVEVRQIRRNQVRIGIIAPREIPIIRQDAAEPESPEPPEDGWVRRRSCKK